MQEFRLLFLGQSHQDEVSNKVGLAQIDAKNELRIVYLANNRDERRGAEDGRDPKSRDRSDAVWQRLARGLHPGRRCAVVCQLTTNDIERGRASRNGTVRSRAASMVTS